MKSMNLADIAIRRPVFTAMMAAALMVLGARSLIFELGVDLFPDINFPIVVVNTAYPGAGPAEVESLVTRPIEDSVASINGLDRVKSFSREGLSTVVVQFKLETDIKLAAVDVREKVAQVRGTLPKDIYDPIVARMDPSATPVLTYTLSAERPPQEIRQIADDLLKTGLESVDGVAGVTVKGGLEREIQVELNAAKLQALGLSPSVITQALQAEGLDVPAGRFTIGGEEVAIRAQGQFRKVEEIGEIILPTMSRTPVKLKEVATIIDGTRESRLRARVNGKDSVAFDVIKAPKTNSLSVVDNVQKKLAKLEAQLPPGYKLVKIMDTSVFIEENTHEVNIAIIFGGMMAILIIFLFMLDWRSTLISALALPTSVITTFFVMDLLGFSLNMMSLMGLSLAIGLLIDDAVVVRENIFRHMEMGKDPMRAASEGTKEIALAVLATTLTIEVVFIPVAFTKGMIGQFFRQFGLTVAAAVAVSLFIAFTLDPMLSARLVKPIDEHGHQKDMQHWFKGPILRFLNGLDASYRQLLAMALRHRVVVMVSAAILFFGSLFLVKFIGTEFFPKPDRGQFEVYLDMPAGTSIDVMDNTVKKAESLIAENHYIEVQYTTVGLNSDPTKARIRVIAVDKNQRPQTMDDLKEEIRDKLATIPDLRTTMLDVGFIEGAVEAPVTLNVRGEDYDTLIALSEKVKAVVKATPGATDVASSYVPGKPELQVVIDRAKAGDLGISMAQLGLGLRNAIEGDVATRLRQGEKLYDIRVRLRPEDRNDQSLLDTYTFQSRSGRLVRLGEFATVVPASGPAVIEREGRQRQITITAGTLGRSLGDVVADIQKGLDSLEKPAGYSYVFTGEAERMADSVKWLGIALVLGIIFIYLVLASQFESFIHPFTIMFSLPMAIVGALLSLFLTGSSLGLSTFIGIILLMGLVTKNAILLVDYTNHLREEKGLPLIEALLEAGPTRLRPIVMTSLAMILGMLPTALSTGSGSEFRQPMATAIIGGVITSTILTLVVVPVVYTWMDRLTARGRRERRAAREGGSSQVVPLRKGASMMGLLLAAGTLAGGSFQADAAPGPAPAAQENPATTPASGEKSAPTPVSGEKSAPTPATGAQSAPVPTAERAPDPTAWGAERSITLEEAFDLALKQSPDIAIMRSRLDQASLIKDRVIAALQPMLSLGASFTHSSVEDVKFGFGYLADYAQLYTDYQLYSNGLQPQEVTTSNPNPQLAEMAGYIQALEDALRTEFVIQPQDSYAVQAQVVWGIFNARTIPQLNMALSALKATESATAHAQRELLYGVAQLYYGLYALQQVVDVSARQLESKRYHRALTEARLLAGQVAQSDVLRADVEVVQAERHLRDARLTVHNAAAELAIFLGLKEVELRASVPATQVRPEGTPEALANRALDARADIRSARSQVDAARSAVTDSKMDFLPSIALNGVARMTNQTGFSDEKVSWSVGANASLPVWDGGMRIANLKENRYKLYQAQESLKKLELQVRKEVHVAAANVDQNRVNLDAADQELKLARRTTEQVEALYKAGRATSLELRDAQLLVTASELNRVRATLALEQSLLALNRAVGTFAADAR